MAWRKNDYFLWVFVSLGGGALMAFFLLLAVMNISSTPLPSGYENAPFATTNVITVGPTTVRLGEDRVRASNPWLDAFTVGIEQDRGTLEIIEFRAFDSATMEPLTREGFGLSMDSGGFLTLVSTEEALPERVDLWFRAYSRHPSRPTWNIPPKAGESVQVDGAAIRIKDIADGATGFDGKFTGEDAESTGVIFTVAGDPKPPYQVAAITHDDKAIIPDAAPHFLTANSDSYIFYPVALEQIREFRVMVASPRHVFFFRDIPIEKRAAPDSEALPAVTVDVQGQAVERVVTEWDPIKATVSVEPVEVIGTSSTGSKTTIHKRPASNEVSVIIVTKGWKPPEFTLRVHDREGREQEITRRGAHRSGTTNEFVTAISFDGAIEDVGTVHIERQKPDP